MRKKRKRTPIHERFWRHVTIPADTSLCWEWSGGLSELGYGSVYSEDEHGRRRNKAAHRISYEIHHGSIPDGAVIRHTCDNRKCVNPMHLLSGTQQDNIRDRVERGRNGIPAAKPKLPRDQITLVRRRYFLDLAKQRDIAKEFGVSQRTVTKIVRRVGGYSRY